MIAVIFTSTLFGAWKGMAWQLAALASVVLSMLVAIRCSGPLAPYIHTQAPWNHFLAMLALYALTSLVIWLAFRLVGGAIERVQLKEFDRQLGALFGAAKGVLWCLVLTFFAVTLSDNGRQLVLHSRSGAYTAMLINRAEPLLPAEVRGVVGKYLDELDRRLDPRQDPGPAQPGKTPTADKGSDSGPPGFSGGFGVLTEHKKHYRTLRGAASGRRSPQEHAV